MLEASIKSKKIYRFVIDLLVKHKSNDKSKKIYGFVTDLLSICQYGVYAT